MEQLSHSNISTPNPTIFHESIPLEFMELNADAVIFDEDTNIFKAYYTNESKKTKLFKYNGKEMLLVDEINNLSD